MTKHALWISRTALLVGLALGVTHVSVIVGGFLFAIGMLVEAIVRIVGAGRRARNSIGPLKRPD